MQQFLSIFRFYILSKESFNCFQETFHWLWLIYKQHSRAWVMINGKRPSQEAEWMSGCWNAECVPWYCWLWDNYWLRDSKTLGSNENRPKFMLAKTNQMVFRNHQNFPCECWISHDYRTDFAYMWHPLKRKNWFLYMHLYLHERR